MPRPRLNPEAPLTNAGHQARWRARQAEAGGRRVTVPLDADDAARLAALEAASGETAAAIIRRLIRQAG